MKGLIVAAGRGSRMSHLAPCKPLLSVLGVPLILRVVDAARSGGVDEVVVVTGYGADQFTAFLEEVATGLGLRVTALFNPQWEQGNGWSLLRAREALSGTFALLMCDHLFDPTSLAELIRLPAPQGLVLAVDRDIEGNRRVQPADVTRVLADDDDRILAIGRGIRPYNAYDTGMFLCTDGVFDAVEASVDAGDGSITGAVRHLARAGQARVWDIGRRFWMDVDDERDLRLAEHLLAHPAAIAERKESGYEGTLHGSPRSG